MVTLVWGGGEGVLGEGSPPWFLIILKKPWGGGGGVWMGGRGLGLHHNTPRATHYRPDSTETPSGQRILAHTASNPLDRRLFSSPLADGALHGVCQALQRVHVGGRHIWRWCRF